MQSRFSVVTSIVIAMLIASLDTTIMNTTLPVIVKELGDFKLYAWVFASYMIISTVTSPIYGRLADIYGRKRIFAISVVLFMIGSLLSGWSRSMVQLILFRAIQGIGAGGILPLAVIIAGDLYSVEQRGKIQALFTGMWGLAAVLGPMLGSVLVEYATWRWIFYINIPLGIIVLLLLIRFKEEFKGHKTPVDYWGALIFTISISLLLLVTIVTTNQMMWFIAGLVLLFLFIRFEQKQKDPLIPLSLFKNRTVSAIIINTFLACTALFGTSSYVPLFLQKVAGESIYQSGLVLVGTAIGWMAAAVPAGKWIIRMGGRLPLIIGNASLVLSGIMLLFLNNGTGFWYVFLIMIVQGYAFGLLLTVSIILCQQLVRPEEKGVSTSLQMFARNMGTAIGVTIMGSLLNHGASILIGIQHLFEYGCILSVIAFISALLIQERKKLIM
ncbi:MDR family MFS transporter [Aneurinibacillus sp. Ricciae_BoGa-3]|uniref:MDR family MFS transporter n=1 Tax=Aneurinibacillus sp. Ricciae_BoGa-3 TaxID=3022697 RepID=UPI00233FEB90|nr:MDR family MFS transporter [Aneurinibacillus sp. Ricciae_BoGa-3]WCK54236.1 MDR family MFS transporter [Aneurinibacillus sp. Ricciae_BoGa-3]